MDNQAIEMPSNCQIGEPKSGAYQKASPAEEADWPQMVWQTATASLCYPNRQCGQSVGSSDSHALTRGVAPLLLARIGAMVSDVSRIPVRVALVGAGGTRVLRVGRLTDEFTEAVAEHAMAKECTVPVTVTVPRDTSDPQLAQVRERFAVLERHGISVRVGRSLGKWA